MDKTKPAPVPEQPKRAPEVKPTDRAADPKFVRGTIDPTTKKER